MFDEKPTEFTDTEIRAAVEMRVTAYLGACGITFIAYRKQLVDLVMLAAMTRGLDAATHPDSLATLNALTETSIQKFAAMPQFAHLDVAAMTMNVVNPAPRWRNNS